MPYHAKTKKKRAVTPVFFSTGKKLSKTKRGSYDSDSSSDGNDSDSSSSSGSSSDDDNHQHRKRTSSKRVSLDKNSTCPTDLSFEDCELHILRAAVDEAEEVQGKKIVNSSEVQKIISIVENFLKKKNLICYGGTAINNILPKKDQFYNKELEIPDYDFFSPSALEDSKELADIYFNAGFEEVEAKSGQHFGTFKVFVNFIPVADITSVPEELYKKLKKEAKRVNGVMYAPPNYLRMSMYLELSRPAGDVSRWEKVLKRLSILNKHYPIGGQHCDAVEFQRKMEDGVKGDLIYDVVKQTLIDQGCVFFGGYALSLYSKYLPDKISKRIEKNPDFDVLSEDPLMVAEILKERLSEAGIKRVKMQKLPGIGEIISPHYEITVGSDTVAMIYEPLACHSYNIITQGANDIYIATIDTMLSFYLAFLYVGDFAYNYDPERVHCMSHYLFELQQKNRLNQKGLLKRFSLNCIGHQETIEEIRAKKSSKFVELKNKKNTKEYEEWFLRYRPVEIQKKTQQGSIETPTLNPTSNVKKTRKKKKTNSQKFEFNIFK
jgi:hypothetical protein